jgi:molybdopterin-guanine dinucleotide biosynthesis protein A
MGGQRKSLIPLAGKSLLAHVIARLRPQVRTLLLSVETHDHELDAFELPQLPDPAAGSNGPLGGLLSALEAVAGEGDWLLLAPCDAPFLPPDLGARLLRGALDAGALGAVARYLGELQPTFSLWHRELLPALRRAVLKDRLGGFKQFLSRQPLPAVDWPGAEVPPFFNVNTPQDLARASALVDLLPPGM